MAVLALAVEALNRLCQEHRTAAYCVTWFEVQRSSLTGHRELYVVGDVFVVAPLVALTTPWDGEGHL